MKPTRLDYCQYLLVSHINYTLTHCADHTENMSHDALNRYLKDERGVCQPTGRLVWESVGEDLVQSENGFLVFDDSVSDNDFSHKIEVALTGKWVVKPRVTFRDISQKHP